MYKLPYWKASKANTIPLVLVHRSRHMLTRIACRTCPLTFCKCLWLSCGCLLTALGPVYCISPIRISIISQKIIDYLELRLTPTTGSTIYLPLAVDAYVMFEHSGVKSQHVTSCDVTAAAAKERIKVDRWPISTQRLISYNYFIICCI